MLRKNVPFGSLSFLSVVHVLSDHVYVSSTPFSISLAIVS